ncbi:MAG: hypothetical protein IT366_11545 [Candidatus Hydrogenedentes bacterium]|nr:hypothetical protein [Candidatus Hydrogenedentota bacterium]
MQLAKAIDVNLGGSIKRGCCRGASIGAVAVAAIHPFGGPAQMTSRTVFYSWQLDSDDRFNRSFIDDCLRLAIRKLNREDLANTVVHRDTNGANGSAGISKSVLDKLAGSAIIVADLTIVNPKATRRPGEWPACNPSVSFEVGCAWGLIGADSVIGIINTAYGDVKELPVELRLRRMLKYDLTVGEDKSSAKEQLVDDLADAIGHCLGISEEEQKRRVFDIHRILSRIWLLGTEFEEWFGIDELANVVQNMYVQAQSLPELMRTTFDSDDMWARAICIAHSLERAANIPVTEENLPRIREHVSSAMTTVLTITERHHFAVDPSYRAELLERIAAVSQALDWHMDQLQNRHFHRRNLEELSYDLRMIAFKRIMPDQTTFNDEFMNISFDLRRCFLRWVKRKPKHDEGVAAIRDIRDRLTHLLDTCDSVTEEQMLIGVA